MLSCKKNPTESGEPPKPPGYQEDITWPSLADSPWPMNHHDPQSTGRCKYGGPKFGQISWQYDISGINSALAFTSFILGEDSTIYFGSSYEYDSLNQQQNSFLYAISFVGLVKWKFPLNYPYVSSSPIITSSNFILIGSGDNNLYAITLDGKLKWKYKADESIFLEGINIDKLGNIYVVINDGSLISLDQTGNLRWRLTTDGGFYSSSMTGISISPNGETLYVTGNISKGSKSLYAISTEGNVIWKFGSNTYLNQPVVDSQGNIYINYNNKNDSLNYGFLSLSSAGVKRWVHNSVVGDIVPTIDKNGNIYFAGEKGIVSVDYNGNFRWEFSANNLYPTSALLCDISGNIYYASSDFVALNNNGTIKYVVEINDVNYSTPAIGFDQVCLGSVNNPKIIYSIR